METGKNIATENFIVRLWSKDHYPDRKKVAKRYYKIFDGTITEVQSKKEVKFHSVGEFIKKTEKLYYEAQKRR